MSCVSLYLSFESEPGDWVSSCVPTTSSLTFPYLGYIAWYVLSAVVVLILLADSSGRLTYSIISWCNYSVHNLYFLSLGSDTTQCGKGRGMCSTIGIIKGRRDTYVSTFVYATIRFIVDGYLLFAFTCMVLGVHLWHGKYNITRLCATSMKISWQCARCWNYAKEGFLVSKL